MGSTPGKEAEDWNTADHDGPGLGYEGKGKIDILQNHTLQLDHAASKGKSPAS